MLQRKYVLLTLNDKKGPSFVEGRIAPKLGLIPTVPQWQCESIMQLSKYDT